MALVQGINISKLIVMFIGYLLVHIILAIVKKTYENKKITEQDTYNTVKFLFKWWPAIYLVLLILVLYGTR